MQAHECARSQLDHKSYKGQLPAARTNLAQIVGRSAEARLQRGYHRARRPKLTAHAGVNLSVQQFPAAVDHIGGSAVINQPIALCTAERSLKVAVRPQDNVIRPADKVC